MKKSIKLSARTNKIMDATITVSRIQKVNLERERCINLEKLFSFMWHLRPLRWFRASLLSGGPRTLRALSLRSLPLQRCRGSTAVPWSLINCLQTSLNRWSYNVYNLTLYTWWASMWLMIIRNEKLIIVTWFNSAFEEHTISFLLSILIS